MLNLANILTQTNPIPAFGVMFLLSACLIADIIHDFYQIEENHPINYNFHNALITFLVTMVLISGYAMMLPVKILLAFAILFPSVRWFVHDYGLNRVRGLKLSYLGTRSKTDRLLTFMRDEVGLNPFFVRLIAFFVSGSIALNILML